MRVRAQQQVADFVGCRMSQNHRQRSVSTLGKLFNAITKDAGTRRRVLFGWCGNTQRCIAKVCSGRRGM